MSEDFTLEDRLKERVKELSCLYEISNAIRKYSGHIEITLKKICEITQKAWRFPEAAVVHLNYNEFFITTASRPVSFISQESKLTADTVRPGTICVYYDSKAFNEDAFLEEEQQLLDQIAIEISDFLDREAIKEREAVLKRKAEHNDRLAILGEITAGIAHELNTPLGNILGFAELIKADEQNPQTQIDITKIIKASIYSREIVKKLMFFSCEIPHQKTRQQIKPIIDQAISLLSPNLKKAGIDCNFTIDKEDLALPIDTVQITQVIFNLVINAIYASAPGKKITIAISTKAEHMILEISDEGVGIPIDLRKKVFNPFFSTKPVGEGSGLGLSVVHGIIKAHNGEIVILENSPKGSIFKIILPL